MKRAGGTGRAADPRDTLGTEISCTTGKPARQPQAAARTPPRPVCAARPHEAALLPSAFQPQAWTQPGRSTGVPGGRSALPRAQRSSPLVPSRQAELPDCATGLGTQPHATGPGAPCSCASSVAAASEPLEGPPWIVGGL